MAVSTASLSLFYWMDDATRRGAVLWGEGVVEARSLPQFVRSEPLSDGLRILRVVGPLEDVARQLQADHFPYRRKRGVVEQIKLGLVRRPPIASASIRRLAGEVNAGGVVHHFVRAQKADALGFERRPADQRDRRRVAALLEGLKYHAGIDFHADAHLLGDTVLAEESCFHDEPVRIRADKRDGNDIVSRVLVEVNPGLAGDEIFIGLTLTGSDGMIVDDLLLSWRVGMDTTLVVPINQRVGGAEVRAWRKGKLVSEQSIHFILEFALNTNLMGRTVVLHDRLTELLEGAIQAGNAPAAAMAGAQRVRHDAVGNRSIVGVRQREPWRTARISAAHEMYEIAPPPPDPEQYFARGGHGRVLAIQRVIELLGNGVGYLVDPFFDANGAEALLTRLGRDVDLTIVTSLPEAGDVDKLRASLDQMAPFLPGNIKVHRVTRRNSQEQAFHDRYLIVFHEDRTPRGFVLSNSFSGAARQYPLIMTPMSERTTAAVLIDIEELLSRGGQVKALWPRPRERLELHTRFGFGWRFYLNRLIRRRGRSESDWLRAAQGMGWLTLDADGDPNWATRRSDEAIDAVLERKPSSAWLRRLMWRGTRARLPSVGYRVAAIGERAARGLEVTADEIAAKMRPSDVTALVHYLRATFRPAAHRPRRRPGWLDALALSEALGTAAARMSVVHVGLGLWSDTEAMMGLPHSYGRLFVYRVVLASNPDLAFAVGFDLSDPDLLLAALDWFHVEGWPRSISDAAIRSASPLLRALGAQSFAAPNARGDFSPRPEPPAAQSIEEAALTLTRIDRTTAAICALDWGSTSNDEGVRARLAEMFVERVPDVLEEDRGEVFSTLVSNKAFFEATTAAAIASKNAGVLVEGVLRVVRNSALEEKARYAARHLDGAVCISRLIAAHCDGRADNGVALAERGLGVAAARPRAVPISPMRRGHPEWNESVAILAWAQLLARLVNDECGSDEGVPVLVGLHFVHDVCPELLERLLDEGTPGLGGTVSLDDFGWPT